jgi:hypothetical protein
MSQAEPFARVYYTIVADERFTDIYPNDAHLATWLRMLLVAEGTYPAPAPITRKTNPKSLKALVDCGLIELVGDDHYRVHGMRAEREKRSKSASDAAWVRWSGIAPADANALLAQRDAQSESKAFSMLASQPASRDETDETSQPSQSRYEPAIDAYQKVFINVSPNALRFIDELIGEFGQSAVAQAIGQEAVRGRDKLLTRVKTNLLLRVRSEEQNAERQRIEAQRTAVAPIKVVVPEPDLTPEEIEAQAEEWRRDHR